MKEGRRVKEGVRLFPFLLQQFASLFFLSGLTFFTNFSLTSLSSFSHLSAFHLERNHPSFSLLFPKFGIRKLVCLCFKPAATKCQKIFRSIFSSFPFSCHKKTLSSSSFPSKVLLIIVCITFYVTHRIATAMS